MENGAKVTLLSVLAVVGIGIKVLVRASRANRSPSLSSSSSYGDSANERLSGFGNLENRAEMRKALFEAKASLEASVERHCASSARRLYLEPQGFLLGDLFRSLRRANAPRDVAPLPAPTILGLPVMVMADDRWCADTSPSTANDLANETPRLPKESVEKVAPGAWVIHTKKGSPVSASTVLASAAFLRSLGPASLVALAPTDGAIALADASSPASIRVAATRLKPLIDTSLDDGVLQSAPLLFADGQWKPWNGRFPSEVAEVVKLGEFIETRMALDILKDFPTEEDATAMSLVGAPDPPTDFKGGTPTTVDIDPKGRTTVHVDLSLHEDLLVGQADLVEIEDDRGTKTLGWKTFTQKYSKQLEAVMLNGTKVPRVQRLLATASGS